MRQYLFRSAILLAALCSSCTKGTITTQKTTLIGTWKTTQWAPDANNNGVLDVSELDTDTNTIFTFNSDGTGENWNGIHGSGDEHFTWQLASNNDLYLTVESFPTNTLDTYHVDNLTPTDLTLALQVNAKPVLWWVFKKQ